ncbi:MAG TPA: ABC transporter permease [Actinomycetota bacterium]|nr:ABC transporter permease [Actinomycetota bacterium]
MPASEALEPAPGETRGPSAASSGSAGVWYPKRFWQRFAAPATLWLLLFFVLPFYVIVSIAFGTIDEAFRSPVPVYQPWWWTFTHASEALEKVFGPFWPTYVRTFTFVVLASAICLTLGYAVAYYVARFGGRRRTLFLVLLIAPFWISYLMRMLAWRTLLTEGGYVNGFLDLIGLPAYGWLEGKPITVVLGLVYGYIPYMILPLYGFLDRIDASLLEAGRDLGAGPVATFFRVTLPLSRPAILAGLVIVSLPMFGDYYTNNMLSNSPKTTMIGNILDDSVQTSGQGPEAAIFTLILMAILIVPMLYYLRATARDLEMR